MAEDADIETLRRLVDEPTEDIYSDTDLETLLDSGDMNTSALSIWEEKMARYSTMVDTSESGSSRKNSDLFNSATRMAKYYRDILGVEEEETIDVSERPRTRRIVRP